HTSFSRDWSSDVCSSDLSAERRVTLATNTLADLVTQAQGTVSKADLTGFYNAVGPIMDPFPSSSVQITISDYRMSGTTVGQKWRSEERRVGKEGMAGRRR